jgi:hypothetical protein
MITLGAPAPGSGVDIQLSSSESIVNVPAVVHIASGATSATFEIGSRPVRDRVIVSVTATAGALSKSKSLAVNPPALVSVKVQQTSMTGGAAQQGTVLLTGAAPAGGLLVPLSTTNPAVQVPSGVEIPEGATSAIFTIRSVPVVVKSTGVVVAQVGSIKKSTSVNVVPPVVSAITASRSTVVGGDAVDVTVTITGAAPVGGRTVLLTSGNIALKVPASVTVPAGQTSVVFSASSLGVSKSVSVKISGKVGLTTKSTYVSVTPR